MSRFRPIDTPYLPGTQWRVVDALLAVAAGFVAVAVVGTLFFALTGIEPEGVDLLTVTFVVQTLAPCSPSWSSAAAGGCTHCRRRRTGVAVG